ncbi:MAG: two-component sensor histidine kinase [Deltaproteobacteria bacterium]|nr:two-component sensor histidine kinase [Deltaproteobacteria bacterium]MBW2017286.1 two-component sensor histidine kinase [Deltaproteobacteria bacterium]MBW2129734.1 two-component sensor histidine kinase [Deltaproteobacteria bacterium]MBW2304337.1 two-component sensor histidine kinase [Deltaproteobacteria bacterium]
MRFLRPKFWDHEDVAAGPYKHLFNFRRIWKLAVLLTAGVALLPLAFLAAVDYKVTQKSVESEILLRTSRLVSNTRRTISFFLAERKSALDFIVRDNSLEALNEPGRLATILDNLREAFGGGFTDLGVIDPLGYQRTYVGPYKLEGKDYSAQEWYREVRERGVYISDVFLGYRKVPHLVIAVRYALPNGTNYVLRATLEMERFNELLSKLEMSGLGDAFVINREGILQTPSRSHGGVLEHVSLPVPDYSPKTVVFEGRSREGRPLIIGYAYIAETPFILMIVKDKAELMQPWYRSRLELIGFLSVSLVIILCVVFGVATYLVNKIHVADQKRVMTLHQVEYSNKMATIGKLAAGVAHEINNPLAIINEKAGLIKDIINLREKPCDRDEKLIKLVDSVIVSVDRCAAITRRLLSFMRREDVIASDIRLDQIIHEVLGFLGKEAEYRSISITVDQEDGIPPIESDRGRLQEIFLNVINNAFAAMDDGGHLDISIKQEDEDSVSVTITDDGCGIPESDLKRVFEPFFSTKTNRGGTGLGLSITSGLVQEIGGSIGVKSKPGEGTSFTIRLPLQMKKRR